MVEVCIAEQHEVRADAALEWLCKRYNPNTVQYYDCAGASPRDGVTLGDIGRMVVFAARLDFKAAQRLLEIGTNPSTPWKPNGDWRLDGDAKDADESFVKSVVVAEAWALYSCFRGRRADARASKLLHIKWPAFYPILDKYAKRVYRPVALQLQNEVVRTPGGRRRPRHPDVVAYWLAVRQDLLRNRPALDHLRERLNEGTDPHMKRLAGLENLRLLDMLSWGIGRHLSGRSQGLDIA